jgi:hypothetical protein
MQIGRGRFVVELQEIERLLRSLDARISLLERHFDSGPPNATAKKESAKEFLLKKKIGSETQKVLALAYFLERQGGLASFNVPDLESVFRSAREKLPQNMNDVVNKNVARGFMMAAEKKKDSKKAWQLTATGERFVEVEMER